MKTVGSIHLGNLLHRLRRGLLILSLFGAYTAQAQNYQLHSVYLYSFTRYVQWPEEMAHGDFVITVLGESPIYEELMHMAEVKKVGDRAIKVSRAASPGEVKQCNILFIPADKSAQLGELLAKIGSSSTLVVTEQAGLSAKGSAINFVNKDGKLAFELNQSTLNKHKLKASTELTKLAILI